MHFQSYRHSCAATTPLCHASSFSQLLDRCKFNVSQYHHAIVFVTPSPASYCIKFGQVAYLLLDDVGPYVSFFVHVGHHPSCWCQSCQAMSISSHQHTSVGVSFLSMLFRRHRALYLCPKHVGPTFHVGASLPCPDDVGVHFPCRSFCAPSLMMSTNSCRCQSNLSRLIPQVSLSIMSDIASHVGVGIARRCSFNMLCH